MTRDRQHFGTTNRALLCRLATSATLIAAWTAPSARAQVTVVSGPQPAGTVAEPTPPPAATPAPAPTAGTVYDCLPACREGFVCVMKQCVSACNPACGAGEVCASGGRCVSACSPPCAAGQQCTSQGQCLAPTPAAPAATSAPAAEPSQRLNYMPGAPPPPSELERHEDEVAERRRTGKRFHDGFYLRLGVGAGYLISKWTPSGESESSGGALGFTVPVELAVGGTPAPGLVLGAGYWGVHAPVANNTEGRGDFKTEEDANYGAISMFGPFTDIYPAPRSGFHLQAAPCLALVAPGSSDTIVPENLSGAGFGAMLGLGYESWVADQWGLGVLLRAQFAYVELSDDSDNRYDFVGLFPGLLITSTFH